MPQRICILETDNLRPELVDQYKGYGHMFQQLFATQPIAAEFEVYNVVKGEYPPEDRRYDAYLITGSKADSFGSDPWIEALRGYVLKLYQRGDKLLGVCFGHQLLALLLGGKTERASQGWGMGIHRYQVTQKPAWMTPQTDTLDMMIWHQDQVTELPQGATLLASSEFCPNAAYAIGDQVLCFQGHPEFFHDYSRDLLVLRRHAYEPSLYQSAIDSLDQAHQGSAVAEWMMRFITQGKAA